MVALLCLGTLSRKRMKAAPRRRHPRQAYHRHRLRPKKRLAALEAAVAKLLRRVAELEEHSSEAASGSGLARPRARPLD